MTEESPLEASHRPAPSPSQFALEMVGHERLFTIVASIYLLGALFGEYVVRALLGPSVTSDPNFVLTHAFIIQSVELALLVPVGWLLLASLFSGNDAYRRALRLTSTTVVWSLALTVVVSLVLNATALWPFTWRFAESGSAPYMRELLQRDSLLTIGLWTTTGVLVIPFIEETLFRYWLLRSIIRWSGSQFLAVTGGALVFAALHLGNPLATPDARRWVNAGWLFVFSVVLGIITLRRSGSIGPALVVHTARNAVEVVTLTIAVVGDYAT